MFWSVSITIVGSIGVDYEEKGVAHLRANGNTCPASAARTLELQKQVICAAIHHGGEGEAKIDRGLCKLYLCTLTAFVGYTAISSCTQAGATELNWSANPGTSRVR